MRVLARAHTHTLTHTHSHTETHTRSTLRIHLRCTDAYLQTNRNKSFLRLLKKVCSFGWYRPYSHCGAISKENKAKVEVRRFPEQVSVCRYEKRTRGSALRTKNIKNFEISKPGVTLELHSFSNDTFACKYGFSYAIQGCTQARDFTNTIYKEQRFLSLLKTRTWKGTLLKSGVAWFTLPN